MTRTRLLHLALATAVVAAPVALAAPAGAAMSPYGSCADVASSMPGAPDGEYALTVLDRTVVVWCADMASTPVEYLTLQVTGGTANYGEARAGTNWHGTTVVTHFSRLRLSLPAAVDAPFTVDATDHRFSTSTGSTAGVTRQSWATGAACSYPWGTQQNGHGSADLTGTPFGISAASFSLDGEFVTGGATQVGPQRVEVSGNGWCGGTGPITPTAVPLTWVGGLAPFVTDAPDDVTVTSGGDAVFTADAVGDGDISTRWQTSGDGGTTWDDVDGVTGTTLTLPGVTTADDGLRVRAVVANAAGTVTTAAATLTVEPTLPVVTGPVATTVTSGEDAVFTIAVTGDPAPTVRWQTTTDGTTWDDVDGVTHTTLTLPGVTTADDRLRVRAVVANTAGTVTTAAATLTVEPTLPVVVSGPVSAAVGEGRSATFSVTVTGDPAPTLQWQWSRDGGAGWTDLDGATGTSVTFVDVPARHDGVQVRVVATNSAGTATSEAAVLTVEAGPVAPPAPAPAPADPARPDRALPVTGAAALGLGGLAATLVATGGAVLLLARRRSCPSRTGA